MIDYTNWTLQRIFNKVSKHLVNQKKKAILNGRTAFSDNDYNRCAFGCLAPLRDHRSSKIIDYYTFFYNGITFKKYELLLDMEKCHDKVKVSRWKQRLRVIARSYDLEIPEFLNDK